MGVILELSSDRCVRLTATHWHLSPLKNDVTKYHYNVKIISLGFFTRPITKEKAEFFIKS